MADTTTSVTTTSPKKALAVVTSTSHYEKVGYRTGLWLGELTHFEDVLAEAGHTVDVVSISGGQVPIDPESLKGPILALGGTKKRYADPQYMARLDDTRSVSDIDVADYDAIYLTGGHGVMFDFPEPALAGLVARFWEAGKIVSAVCHGPCGLTEVTLSDGSHLVDGRTVTGYSWAEEILARRSDAVPYSLQDRLAERGGHYTKATIPMAPHVEVDGRLVTGQNPTSAKAVGEKVVELLA